MCRLVAYFGNHGQVLADLLEKPDHSLIKLSRSSGLDGHGINADGFGIAWYQPSIDPFPGLFKSVRPAWNDQNLTSLARKVSSHCFIGHVRASTVGNVSIANCHPFAHHELSFAHNGTIVDFSSIRRKIISSLSDEAFHAILGLTDSEHFFGLVIDAYEREKENKSSLESLIASIQSAIDQIQAFQMTLIGNKNFRINGILTNGVEMVAFRLYSKNTSVIHPLYFLPSTDQVVISSEPILSLGNENLWQEVPLNSILSIDARMQTQLASYPID